LKAQGYPYFLQTHNATLLYMMKDLKRMVSYFTYSMMTLFFF